MRRYKLTGETGSYRYMAPEVFRHEPYNTKVTISRQPHCHHTTSLNIGFRHSSGLETFPGNFVPLGTLL